MSMTYHNVETLLLLDASLRGSNTAKPLQVPGPRSQVTGSVAEQWQF